MKTRISRTLLLLMTIVLTACTADITVDKSVENVPIEGVKSMKMKFNVNLTGFVGDSKTRGTDWVWDDGAVVYIQYYKGTAVVRGHAVYSKSDDSWEAFWNGSIGEADKCEVYFFDGASATDKHCVSLDATNGIYADKSGSYSINGTEMNVKVSLSPLTSRVRFASSSGMGIEVEGLKYYTGYDADNDQLTTSTSAISGKVASDGYTPYYYCVFADDNRQLTITNSKDGDEVQFQKSFASSVLNFGESGYITIPTEDTNKGWKVKTLPAEQDFTVTGNGKTVSFKMKKVKAGTFQMGMSADGNDVTPVHSVTLTKSYYIGETEVTQGLWYAVMGQKPSDGSPIGLGDDYPAYYISYEDCEKFLTKLNQMTGETFRFPTEAEWEFAAKGGNSSMGYTYSGSNTIGDVAWYKENSSDMGSSSYDYGTHVVKTKAANELGLYDMSGNVWEWCYDYWYDDYPSSAQTNPTGPTTGSLHVIRGGSWDVLALNCRCASRSRRQTSVKASYLGFRLAL